MAVKTMDWQGMRVIVVGAARQGIALARYLAERRARVVVTDQTADGLENVRSSLAGLPVEWALGGHPLSLLEGADMVCPSGGVPLTLPLIQEAQQRGLVISNDSQIFLAAAPCRVIGITGSSGKTTTTTLVGRMATACSILPSSVGGWLPRRVWIGGNIGNPLIASLDEMDTADLAVMELSSFQLEIMTLSPHIAAILNVTPNHLDRHKTMEAYTSAKAHILANQPLSQGCAVVLGRDDPGAWGLAGLAQSPLWSFGRSFETMGEHPGSYADDQNVNLWNVCEQQKVMPREAIALRGEHNLLNVLAATTICAAAGLPLEGLAAGVEGFQGVSHRLEFVRTWHGADWYNNSIATAPERTIAVIRSFNEPIVLLAGGRDKDLPWADFARLVCQRVDHLVLFGECADKIRLAVEAQRQGERPYSLEVCRGLKEAVEAAAQTVEAGDVVLLSPGGTSFDEFRDFEARGEAFRKWVQEL